ncbi:epoxyqueuosine reductase [Candidatus Fermentibacterales bacterium]|nr:epoxyqueuosine reductase [Candidatus Fermentibacterales bacterium]
MTTRALTETLRSGVLALGAGLVGFADLLVLDRPPFGRELSRAVSIAVPLDREVVRRVSRGPDALYAREYDRANGELERIARACAMVLSGMGYRALAMEPTCTPPEGSADTTPLPHKTVATLAGLGWIGRCALLVTPGFGSALRLCSVLTDAPLDAGEPWTDSACGDCYECAERCPGGAVRGEAWRQGVSRERLYDHAACRRTAEELSREAGLGSMAICGICMSVCPFTRAYADGGPSPGGDLALH